jgi:hypothetical protein
MINEQDIMQALAEYEVSEDPNYTKIARNYNLVLFMLLRRIQSKTISCIVFQD